MKMKRPTPDEVSAYAKSVGFKLDGGYFVDYWEARGWLIKPGMPMRSWQATVRNWRRMEIARNNGRVPITPAEERKRDADERRMKVIRESAGRIAALQSWMRVEGPCPYSSDLSGDIEREKIKIADLYGDKGIAILREEIKKEHRP